MRTRNNKKLLTSLFILLILSIGIVYAYLTSNLSITGSTRIANNTWDIHFANLVVNPGSVEATTPAAIDQNDTTTISYAVKLNAPGDFYEFTVDIVNAGTLSGKVNVVSIDGISTYSNIVDYSIIYTSGNPVQIGNLLNPNSSKNIKVRVFYEDDIDADDLPDEPINLDLTFNLTYNQTKELEKNASNLLQNLANTESCITKYEGQVTDRVGITEEATNVYFDKCADKRNIIFGGYCWQAVRTTETGGLKMIYNGEPVDGKCGSGRGQHKIFGGGYNALDLSTPKLYGSSFTYDETTGVFTLIDTFTATWSDSNYRNLMGKYTCKSESNTCNMIYYINGYFSSTNALVTYYSIENGTRFSIGKSSFSSEHDILSRAGYMFNQEYNVYSKSYNTGKSVFDGSDVYLYRGYYSDSISYDEGTGLYTLINPQIIDSSTEISDVLGKYYINSSSAGTSAAIIFYLVDVYDNNEYYIKIKDGHDKDYYNDVYTYGESYTDNGNGTYTINNPSTFNRFDFRSNNSNLRCKYLCINANNNTCSNIRHVDCSQLNSSYYSFVDISKNYKYSSGFTYENGLYTLNNDSISKWDFQNNSNIFKDYHYTCWNETGVCSDILYFFSTGNGYKYINISNGKSVEDAINDMLYADDVNTYSSPVKSLIDNWYNNKMFAYTNYLEDAIYCNNRGIRELGGWNPNGGNLSDYLIFNGYTSKLACEHITDQFAMVNNKARLSYPVGLLSIGEANGLNASLLNAGSTNWWLSSPSMFDMFGLEMGKIRRTDNHIDYELVYYNEYVRPVVSLKSDIIFESGTGSETDPWIVE